MKRQEYGETFIIAERLVMLTNKQQFWLVNRTQLKYFMQKWIVSALGIKQQTVPLTLLFFIFSNIDKSPFGFEKKHTYV